MGYRYGYKQGINTNSAAAVPNANPTKPFASRGDFGRHMMPFHNFHGRTPGFHQNFGMGMHGGMMPFGKGFGFFSPFFFLLRVAIVILILWLAYTLLTGWRVSFTRVNSSNPIEPDVKKEQATNE